MNLDVVYRHDLEKKGIKGNILLTFLMVASRPL